MKGTDCRPLSDPAFGAKAANGVSVVSEVTCQNALLEGGPFVLGEAKRSLLGVLGVAHQDLVAELGDLHAVAVAAPAALTPCRLVIVAHCLGAFQDCAPDDRQGRRRWRR